MLKSPIFGHILCSCIQWGCATSRAVAENEVTNIPWIRSANADVVGGTRGNFEPFQNLHKRGIACISPAHQSIIIQMRCRVDVSVVELSEKINKARDVNLGKFGLRQVFWLRFRRIRAKNCSKLPRIACWEKCARSQLSIWERRETAIGQEVSKHTRSLKLFFSL